MATAEELRREFTNYLDSEGMKYTTVDEADNIVKLAFAPSSNLGSKGYATKVYVDFDEEADPDGVMSVHFVAQNFATAHEDKLPEVFVRLNDLNKRFRWAKFWFDSSDNTISADTDAIIFPGTAGHECLRCVIHVSNIVELACRELKDIAEIAGRQGVDLPDPPDPPKDESVDPPNPPKDDIDLDEIDPKSHLTIRYIMMILKGMNTDEERAAFLMDQVAAKMAAKITSMLDSDMQKGIMMAMLARAMS